MKQKIPRLAIITTHPIQYQSPFFRALASSGQIEIKVYYNWNAGMTPQHDPGFGINVRWDVPLIDGFEHDFVPNIARNPNTMQFSGLNNPTLVTRVGAWKPDFVLIYGWHYRSHLGAMRYFSRRKIPILFRGDSHNLNQISRPRSFLRRLWLTHVYGMISAALYVGTRNREYFESSGVPEHKLFFCPHSVDNDFFSNPTHVEEAAAWRARLGISPSTMVFLYAGKLDEGKGLKDLLQAFCKLGMPDTRLVLIGSGPLDSWLRTTAARDARVIFLPFQNQSQMPSAYRLGDIFVLPSHSETWGLAINEAMACGLPIIASDKVGCAVDLVRENGLVFRVGDVADLSSALAAASSEPDTVQRWAEQSRKRIQDWSIDRSREGLIQCLESLTHSAGHIK